MKPRGADDGKYARSPYSEAIRRASIGGTGDVVPRGEAAEDATAAKNAHMPRRDRRVHKVIADAR